MSKFQQLLLVFTIIAIIALIGFGVFQKTLISKKVDEFTSLSNTLNKIESIPGGPTVETEEVMKSDMEYYKKSIEVLKKSFANSSDITFKDIESSEFSGNVGAAHKEIMAKYDEACVKLPKEWYLGFEKYSNAVAPKSATGKLSYGLEAITYLHEELLNAKPQALINLYRKQIAEELGGEDEKKEKYFEMPLELTFAAKEKNAKQFINALVNNDRFFFTINTIKIKEVNGRRYACDRLEVVESSAELDGEGESASIEDALSGDDKIVYSPKKKFDQVLGDESLVVFLDLNLVYIPKEEAPKGKAKKKNN